MLAPVDPNSGLSKSGLSFPFCNIARVKTWPFVAIRVPLGCTQLAQVKKFAFGLLVGLGEPAKDSPTTDRESLLLKPWKLLWLKTLMASARNSKLSRSA